jgi:hypothetical protein
MAFGEWLHKGASLRRTFRYLLIAWVPLIVLTAIPRSGANGDELSAFAFDYAVQLRFLIAMPLLLLAHGFCRNWIDSAATRFASEGLIREADGAHYHEALSALLRLRDTKLVRAVLLLLAIIVSGSLMQAVPHGDWPEWILDSDSTFSWAGWWHALVSLPILLALIFSWFWHLALWARFLHSLSRLKLSLLCVHPDLIAGLRFVAYSSRAWFPLATATSTVVAGTIANEVLHHQAPIADYRVHMGVTVLLITLICLAPPLFLMTRLLDCWRDGVFRYGALAQRVGSELQRRWAKEGVVIDARALETQDFSATFDLFSAVANVYQMRIVPVDWRSALFLACAAALPFAIVLLAALPLEVTLEGIASLVL